MTIIKLKTTLSFKHKPKPAELKFLREGIKAGGIPVRPCTPFGTRDLEEQPLGKLVKFHLKKNTNVIELELNEELWNLRRRFWDTFQLTATVRIKDGVAIHGFAVTYL